MSDGISFRNRLGTSRERKPVWFSFFFKSFAFVDVLCYNKSIERETRCEYQTFKECCLHQIQNLNDKEVLLDDIEPTSKTLSDKADENLS